jgi:hypothetical protein
MRRQSIADPFTIDEIHFRDCFSAPSLKHFVALLIGWALTVGKHTVSNVIMTMELHESKHFATIYRFLARAQWDMDSVSRQVLALMVQDFTVKKGEVVLVVDDTLNKHCGRKICGAAWQHDGAAPKHSKRFSYGVCFIIIGMAVRLPEIAERTFCLPFAARLWWPESAKVKPRGVAHRTKPQLALELITLARSWIDESHTVRVVGDIGYSCETILKGRPKGVHFTGRVRMDSALYHLPEAPVKRYQGRPRKKGARRPTPAQMFTDPCLAWTEVEAVCYGETVRLMVHRFTAIWYHAAGNEHLTFVLCHDPAGKHADCVFFDTDPEAAAQCIVERYATRFSIEITNRETKRLLGASDPQCRSEKAVMRTPMLAYWTYCLVVLWFAAHFSTAKRLVGKVAPWYRQKKAYAFSDMLTAARRSHFSSVFLTEAGHNKEFTKKHGTRSTREPGNPEYAKL